MFIEYITEKINSINLIPDEYEIIKKSLKMVNLEHAKQIVQKQLDEIKIDLTKAENSNQKIDLNMINPVKFSVDIPKLLIKVSHSEKISNYTEDELLFLLEVVKEAENSFGDTNSLNSPYSQTIFKLAFGSNLAQNGSFSGNESITFDITIIDPYSD